MKTHHQIVTNTEATVLNVLADKGTTFVSAYGEVFMFKYLIAGC